MSTTASQITRLTSVYSTVYTRRRSKKPQSSAWWEFTGDRWIPRASNAENVFIRWRHHVLVLVDFSRILQGCFTSTWITVYPKKYAHGFVVLCFVVVTQSFIMNSHEVFIHIHQGCFAGTGAIVRLPQCQWSKPDGYGKISQCITTTKHSKAKTVCIFLGIYCTLWLGRSLGQPWRKLENEPYAQIPYV